VHFHEYFSKDDYQSQSFLERLGRKYDLTLFKRAEWISHTNKDRIELLKIDIDFIINKAIFKIIPNNSFKSWVYVHAIAPRYKLDIKLLFYKPNNKNCHVRICIILMST
jgi:hypothetical protein